jgi:hypothetical protein
MCLKVLRQKVETPSATADLWSSNQPAGSTGDAAWTRASPPKVVEAPMGARHFLIPPSHLFQLPFALPLLVAD